MSSSVGIIIPNICKNKIHVPNQPDIDVWDILLSISGYVFSTPLKNMSSSVGIMTFPIYGKIKFMFQTNQIYIYIYVYIWLYPWYKKKKKLHKLMVFLVFTNKNRGFTNNIYIYIPSGKRLHNYGKSPFLLGKSTISMAIIYVNVYQRVYLHDTSPRGAGAGSEAARGASERSGRPELCSGAVKGWKSAVGMVEFI